MPIRSSVAALALLAVTQHAVPQTLDFGPWGLGVDVIGRHR